MSKSAMEFQTFISECLIEQSFSIRVMQNIKQRFLEIQNTLTPLEKANALYQILLQENQYAPVNLQKDVIDFYIQFLKEINNDSQINQTLYSKIINNPIVISSQFSYLILCLMQISAQNALLIQKEIISYLKLKGLDYPVHRLIDQIFINHLICEESYYLSLLSFDELLKQYCAIIIKIGCTYHYDKVLNILYTRCKNPLITNNDLVQLLNYYSKENDLNKTRFLSRIMFLRNPDLNNYIQYRNHFTVNEINEQLPTILHHCKKNHVDAAIKLYEQQPVSKKELSNISLSEIFLLKDRITDETKSEILSILKDRIFNHLQKEVLADELIDLIEVISCFDLNSATIYCGLSSISSYSMKSPSFRYKYLMLLKKLHLSDKMNIYLYQ